MTVMPLKWICGVLGVDKGMVIIAVFLDLKRAFETIDRKIVLQKLHHYGITETEYNWFKSYLDDRYQKTGFNGVMSAIRKGSVLGPILFVLYVNDIILAVQHSTVNLFADDTLLSIVGNNVEECLAKMNEDLARLAEWINFNKLKLNADKMKYMIITSRRTEAASHSNLKMYAEVIQRVKTMKYLGVTIDQKLTFKDHLATITKKSQVKLVSWEGFQKN
jgi:Reverse transcriptase (RNA-dependent DNA polymerase)